MFQFTPSVICLWLAVRASLVTLVLTYSFIAKEGFPYKKPYILHNKSYKHIIQKANFIQHVCISAQYPSLGISKQKRVKLTAATPKFSK
jgi:hypothetical protein